MLFIKTEYKMYNVETCEELHYVLQTLTKFIKVCQVKLFYMYM